MGLSYSSVFCVIPLQVSSFIFIVECLFLSGVLVSLLEKFFWEKILSVKCQHPLLHFDFLLVAQGLKQATANGAFDGGFTKRPPKLEVISVLI